MRRLSKEIGRPVTFALSQHDVDKDQWRRVLALCAEAAREGSVLRPQVASRPADAADRPPDVPSLLELPPELPRAGGAAAARARGEAAPDRRCASASCRRSRRPAIRAIAVVTALIENGLHKIFPLGDPPDYEPAPEQSLRAIAQREGRDAYEVLYDAMLELDGRALLMLTLLGYRRRPRGGARDARVPEQRLRARRRRRPLRRHLRRQHDHVAALRTGRATASAGPGCPSSGW
jgi:N-acyl-D-amino-acid deacylase